MNNYDYSHGLDIVRWHGYFINVPFSGPLLGLLGLLALWTLFWKGLALWHSARRGKPWWFLVLLVVNTAGILEIVYLFGVAKLRFHTLFSMDGEHRG